METYPQNAEFLTASARVRSLLDDVAALMPELLDAAPDTDTRNAISQFRRDITDFTAAMERVSAAPIVDDDPDTEPPLELADDEEPVELPDQPQESPRPKPQADIRPLVKMFTLNDRYRFRRELFGNLDAAMAEALETLALMPDIDQARAYLEEDLCWDMTMPEVEEFIAVIQSYYTYRRP